MKDHSAGAELADHDLRRIAMVIAASHEIRQCFSHPPFPVCCQRLIDRKG